MVCDRVTTWRRIKFADESTDIPHIENAYSTPLVLNINAVHTLFKLFPATSDYVFNVAAYSDSMIEGTIYDVTFINHSLNTCYVAFGSTVIINGAYYTGGARFKLGSSGLLRLDFRMIDSDFIIETMYTNLIS